MASPYQLRILTAAEVATLVGIATVAIASDTGVTIPRELALAMVERESSPKYNANSYRREADGRESWGLLQILTPTAQWLGYTGTPRGLLDPATGLYWGLRYLAYQLKRYNGNVAQAVAAYNAGTAKPDGKGGFVTTPGYVSFVLSRFNSLLALARDNPGATAGLALAALAVAVLANAKGGVR